MKLEGNLFKIKKGKLDQWKNWCNQLDTNLKEEAIETIKEEGNVQELFLLFAVNDQHYTIGLAKGANKPATDREINNKHRQVARECLEKIGSVENLYELLIQ